MATEISLVAWGVREHVRRDRLSIIAAGVAFYGLLSVFPGLVALVGIYGLAADPAQVERHAASLSAILPAQAAEVLMTQLRDLASTDRTALGIGAIGGLLLALWSASAAVRTLMETLNVAYDEEESRGFIRFYGTALVLTLGAAGAVVILLMWFLLSAYAVLIGAELNAEMERQRR